MSIDADTGLITGPFRGAEKVTVTVRATDPEGLFVDDGFDIVARANGDPVLNQNAAARDRLLTVGETVAPMDVTGGISLPLARFAAA